MGQLSTHFNRKEFKCRCNQCEFDTVDTELLKLLEEVRVHFEKPVVINSACRCKEHNFKVGGKDNSQHLFGRAADIVIHNVPPDKIYHFLDNRYPTQYGLGLYSNFVHIDSRGYKARW